MLKNFFFITLLSIILFAFNVNSAEINFGKSVISSKEIKSDLDPKKNKITVKNAQVKFDDGSIYNGISSFEKEAKGISQHRATRWRKHLRKDHQQLIEFLCGPEMSLFGYKTDFNLISKEQIGEVISCLEDDIRNQKVNWRNDTGNLSLEIGSEIRRWVLSQGTFSQNGLVDRSMFLFDTVKSGILEKKLN